MNEDVVIEKIKSQIAGNVVLLYMKGSPPFPMCGFSARVAQILKNLNTQYAYVNILENPDIRAVLPKFANWPTFPQLYIQGELMGGCDIVVELDQSGDLKTKLEAAGACSSQEPSVTPA